MVKIKGYEIIPKKITNTFDRRAQQSYNKINQELKRIGVFEDDIKIELEVNAFRKIEASVTWYMEGYRMYYSYNLAGNYAENMYMVYKVLATFIDALIDEEITFERFISEFSEDENIDDIRREARKTLGLHENETDMRVIDREYKELAKAHHPDMPNGNTEMFKKINRAHKILRRQLQ
ncbi:molecular chaperone DnaJ [Candidatus Woesearchaeota archaeon CG11_big_fil_rev_8_21_14_0_20_43_8]|nr:MAG: molecular chaperone DnaJ [Candidatus Woesearchaeota archaeon CG11_big_fil_rev_8_21_14_0_20_43_8]